MKATVTQPGEAIEIKYPHLRIDSNDGEVLLFTDKITAITLRQGTSRTGSKYLVGNISSRSEGLYQYLQGSITLQNS